MNKALFLDRDGIINVDYGYTYKASEFEPVDSVVDLIYKAKNKNYLVICITNQSGIQKGYFTQKDFYEFMDVINSYLYKKIGYTLTKTYFCPHDDLINLKNNNKVCNCRKPKNGLFEKAIEEYCIDVDQSIMIGDKLTDVEAAFYSKIKKRILVNSQYNKNIGISKFYTHRFELLKEVLKFI